MFLGNYSYVEKMAFPEEVILINDSPFPTGVYRYAEQVYQATDHRSELINIISSETRWSGNEKGISLQGVSTGPRILRRGINFFLSDLVYRRKLEKNFSLFSPSKRIHYLSQSINPFSVTDRDIVTVHDSPQSVLDTDLYSVSAMHKVLNRRLYNKYRKFQNIMADSTHTKKGLIDYGFEGRIEVIYLPFPEYFHRIDDKNFLRKKLGLPEDKFLVLSITNGVKRKNLEKVEEAVSLLGDKYRLVRIGEPVGGSITFRNIPDQIVNEIYNACDLLLFPSLEEGFGFPVVEAFKVGLPVVSSSIEVIEEVAGKDAILIDPYSTGDIVKGVKEAINSGDELTRRGIKKSEMYSFSSFKKNLLNYYSRL